MSPRSPAASIEGQPVIDLDYIEDSAAGTDANFVMTGKGGIVEIQGTAEGDPFTEEEFSALMTLAKKGIARLVEPAADGGLRGEARSEDDAMTPCGRSSKSALYVTDLDAAESVLRRHARPRHDRQGRRTPRLLPLRRRRTAAVQRRCDRNPAGARRQAAGSAARRARRRAISALPRRRRKSTRWRSLSSEQGRRDRSRFRMAEWWPLDLFSRSVRQLARIRRTEDLGDVMRPAHRARKSSSPATMTASSANSPI